MMRRLMIAAAALAIAGPAYAVNDVTVTYAGAIQALPGNNSFIPQLNALGLTGYASNTLVINLNQASSIQFAYLGSESNFLNSFNGGSPVGPGTFNNFAGPTIIGTQAFTAGTLAGDLNFTSTGAGSLPATVGTSSGFAIFLPTGFTSGTNLSTFYFAYDDNGGNPDDNDFDDYIIRATVLDPGTQGVIPEPGTWAMMILGFGMVGAGLRLRRRQSGAAALS